MFAELFVQMHLSLSLFLNRSLSTRVREDGVQQSSDSSQRFGKPGEGSIGSFLRESLGEKKNKGLSPSSFLPCPSPRTSRSPSFSSFPPTGDSPLQAFIASAMGAGGGRAGDLYERGRGLHFERKEAAEAPPPPENGPIRRHYCLICHSSWVGWGVLGTGLGEGWGPLTGLGIIIGRGCSP